MIPIGDILTNSQLAILWIVTFVASAGFVLFDFFREDSFFFLHLNKEINVESISILFCLLILSAIVPIGVLGLISFSPLILALGVLLLISISLAFLRKWINKR